MKNWLIFLFTASLLLSMIHNTTAEYANIENVTEISQLLNSSLSSLIDSDRLDWNFKYREATFVWSPDSSLLAVKARPDIRTKNLKQSKWGPVELFSALYILNNNGTEILKIASAENSVLTLENKNATYFREVLWTPDSKKLIFGIVYGPIKGTSTEKITKLFLYDLEINQIHVITPPIQNLNRLAMSPDGNSIVYDGMENNVQFIYIVDLANQFEIKKIPVPGAEFPLWLQNIWSREGNRIVFIKHSTAGIELWTVNKDGSNPAILAGAGLSGSVTSVGSSSWSPDGKMLLVPEYHEDQSNLTGLYIADAGGSWKFQVTSGTIGQNGWNSEGNKIYYILHEGDNHKLFSADADGSNTKLLAEGRLTDIALISEDRIVFLSDDDSSYLKSLNIVNLAGTKIVNPQNNVMNYIWNEAVEKISYTTETNNDEPVIYLINPDGTEKKQINKHSYLKSWSPDGSRLIITHSDSPDEYSISIVKLGGYDNNGSGEINNIFDAIVKGKKYPDIEVQALTTPASTPQTPGFTGTFAIVLITAAIFFRIKSGDNP